MKLLSGLSWSWKRAVRLTAMRQRLARRVGVPTTKAGLERKVGRAVLGRLLRLLGR